MRLNHEIIEKGNFIERYVRDELDREGERRFEEHYVNCPQCTNEVIIMQDIIGAVQELGEKEREILLTDCLKQKKNRKSPNRNILQIFELPLSGWMSYSLRVAIPIFVLFSLYGITRLGWPLFLTKSYKHADISSYDFYLSERRSRVSETESDFRKGFESLFNARHSFLGLFPHYDRSQVELALSQLLRSFDAAQEDSDRVKIAFFIGKAYLMHEDVVSACSWFQSVTEQKNVEAFFVEEANRLLNILCN